MIRWPVTEGFGVWELNYCNRRRVGGWAQVGYEKGFELLKARWCGKEILHNFTTLYDFVIPN